MKTEPLQAKIGNGLVHSSREPGSHFSTTTENHGEFVIPFIALRALKDVRYRTLIRPNCGRQTCHGPYKGDLESILWILNTAGPRATCSCNLEDRSLPVNTTKAAGARQPSTVLGAEVDKDDFSALNRLQCIVGNTKSHDQRE